MNLTLLTDLYELTMMQGYFESKKNETVIFDAFYRVNPCGNGFALSAGLDQVIDYIKNSSSFLPRPGSSLIPSRGSSC